MMWKLTVTFEDYEIAGYYTDMECAMCGNTAKAPTLVDRPGFVR